jgi:dihydroorotate dehydrogenase
MMIAGRAFRLLQPALSRLDAEIAHRLAVAALKTGLVPSAETPDEPILRSRVWDLDFANPVGLAAGFDKHGDVPDALLRLGFGLVEVGSITPRPQPGNPRPRLFRLAEDEAVINRYGFNSLGIEHAERRLRARKPGAGGPVGINVGKNKDTPDGATDFVVGIERLCSLADYLVVNISSPNTPGLRDLQARADMERLIERVLKARARSVPLSGKTPPLLVKLAPDLDEIALTDAAEVALASGIDGLIMGNTTLARPASLKGRHRGEAGGLSGKPLFALSTQRLADLYRLTGGRLPLVGCGGVSSGADAYAKIRAGASLVQLYSALVYEGPDLVWRVKRDLAALLRRDGFASVAEAVGADHR